MALGPDYNVPIAGREPRLSGNTLNRAWSPEKDSDLLSASSFTKLPGLHDDLHSRFAFNRAFATCYGLGLHNTMRHYHYSLRGFW